MKQSSLMKRVIAVLMAATLTTSTFPQFHTNVHATEKQVLTKEQFATAEELKTFDTNDKNGKNPAKIYFGNNGQQWWIAGSQREQGLTLFAVSDLVIDQPFEPNWDQFGSNWGQNKQYSDDWNCDYTSTGSSNPSDVYPNHYGASPLRSRLQGLETSYFTGTEQSLMNSTTVYTNDTKNSSTYSTTDKLYLAYGDYDDTQYITVGKNSSENEVKKLNNGLRIDKTYWENYSFWLRAPYVGDSVGNEGIEALCANPDYFDVYNDYVNDPLALVPAFELNLSSVIFASAALAASSDGKLDVKTVNDKAKEGAYTLRYRPRSSIGTATISQSKERVAVTGITNENTYLVVQNKDGAWSKKVTNKNVVSASEMSNTLTSFENCKVWLETTNERITYATLADEEQDYDVNITASEGLTVSNGGQSVAQGSAITDITVEVSNGYYLPGDYISNLQGLLNGLTATKTDNGFTISGTPTSDVNITLPAATPKATLSDGKSLSITKELRMPEGTATPNTTFQFEFTYTGYTTTQDGTPDTNVNAPTIAPQSISYTKDLTGSIENGIKYVVKDTDNILDGISSTGFTKPGLYYYTVKEKQGTYDQNMDDAVESSKYTSTMEYSGAEYTVILSVVRGTRGFEIEKSTVINKKDDNGTERPDVKKVDGTKNDKTSTTGEKTYTDTAAGGGTKNYGNDFRFVNKFVRKIGSSTTDPTKPEGGKDAEDFGLWVGNNVTGKMGDPTKLFDIGVTVKNPGSVGNIVPYSDKYKAYIVKKDDTARAANSYVTVSPTEAKEVDTEAKLDTTKNLYYVELTTAVEKTFKLKHNMALVMYEVPVGAKFRTNETAPGQGYTATLELFVNGKTVSVPTLDSGEQKLGDQGKNTAFYTNNKEETVVTGVIMEKLPFIAMSFVAGIALVLIVISNLRKSRRNEI